MPRVFIPVQLRDLTSGDGEVEASGETVRAVVADLEARFPGIAARLCKDGELSPALQVSIDGTLSRRGLDARVPAASEVHFLPVFGGG
jgi:molybdopterin converting factor small subunit